MRQVDLHVVWVLMLCGLPSAVIGSTIIRSAFLFVLPQGIVVFGFLDRMRKSGDGQDESHRKRAFGYLVQNEALVALFGFLVIFTRSQFAS